MGDKKISELTALTTPDGAEELVVNDGGTSKKITIDNIFNQDIDVTGTITGDLTGDVTGDLTGDVTGDLTGDVTGDLTGESTLPAISTDITDTAVDVFVYDTRKDSDGGAWRKRTQHTSWYNETLNTSTRGSRKEFPAVAVIVAESNKVTIYDGDDPSLPMWMVFNGAHQNIIQWNSGTSHSSVYMLNGIMYVGNNTYDLYKVSFINEQGLHIYLYGYQTYKYDISGRNLNSSGYDGTYVGQGIVNRAVNDIAMTVLPDAPIDPATGLPVPTIAVATAGGVSVIKDDGTVVDIADAENNAYYRVDFSGEQLFIQSSYLDYSPYVVSIPNSDVTGYSRTTGEPSNTKEDYRSTGSNAGLNLADLRFLAVTGQNNKPMIISGDERFISSSQGLSKIAANRNLPSEGMVAYTTSSYNTGWMNGDIKLATLSDTDDTDVTGSELVTNGTFDSDSGWNKGTGWTISGGTASCDGTQTANSQLSQAISGLTVGAIYQVTFDLTVNSGAINYVSFFTFAGDDLSTSQSYSLTVVADNTSELLAIVGNSSFVGSIDNVSVRLAEPDRSVNGNGLQVFGTVTKSPVATGADLVAYSGFSASNYLEQPYNSDLDFGTGDFCVMGWIRSATADRVVLDRADSSADFRYSLSENSSGYWQFYMKSGASTGSVIGTSQASSTRLDFVCVVRRAGTLEMWVNGRLEASAANTINITASSQPLVLGAKHDYTQPLNGSIALFRISATAPTAEQIAKIYEDEKVLFQENAKATLYGSSDAVTALAYDDDTNLLHVGTSAGRSDFQGLRRVDNTTDAVGAAISASNGLIAED